MARIRSNFFSGTLSSQLLSGSTTLMSAALASFPEVAGSDVAYLVVDPDGTTPEIVKVTAHATSATSATVERGQDSTTDRTWSAGVTVMQAPVASDLEDIDGGSA